MTLRRAHLKYRKRTEGTSLTGGKEMGYVYAEIDLTREDDLALVRHGKLRDEEVKTVTVRALVDSSAWDLVITEEIQKQLALPIVGKDFVQLEDDTIMEVDLAGPIQVRFENQTTYIYGAIVMPASTQVLLGAFPMQGLDVYIDPKSERLLVHPQEPDNPKSRILHVGRGVSLSI